MTFRLALPLLLVIGCSHKEAATSLPAPTSTPIATPAPIATAATPPPSSPTARFIGRFDMSNAAAPRFAWSGSSILTRFEGTGLTARLRDEGGNNHFLVVVDGEPKGIIRTSATKDSYPLVQGLAKGVHEVALYKRTEARVGETAFLGFEPDRKSVV